MDNKDLFKKNGYIVVRSAISTELRDFITQYALFDEMQDFTPEKSFMSAESAQCAEAHSKYGDPAIESMLVYLHPIIEKNIGLTLFPTYSYYRIYRNGDVLTPHVDRPSCEISATVCFNFNYDPTNVWSIYMAGNKLDLMPGDMAVYKGCDIPHWREPFDQGENAWQVQAFFHYVDATGTNAEWKWDKRSSLGMLGVTSKLQLKDHSSLVVNTQLEKSYIQYTK